MRVEGGDRGGGGRYILKYNIFLHLTREEFSTHVRLIMVPGCGFVSRDLETEFQQNQTRTELPFIISES